MYAWGNNANTFRGKTSYEYDSARRAYLNNLSAKAAAKGPRTYSRGAAGDWDKVNPKDKDIESDSTTPIVVAVDVTGSMADWPGEIFDRLPLLYQTLSQYKEDLDISFCAIGDAHSDSFPLQVNNFAKELDLEDSVAALIPEGGGGGQARESYELFGAYMMDHCHIPNAVDPFLLIFGDEGFYDPINQNQVEHYTVKKTEFSDSNAMWKALGQKFNVYHLHKPYFNGDEPIVRQWSKALGPEKVVELPSKERAVDLAMGIVAKHWGQYGDFSVNLSARQPNSSVQNSVHHSLRYIPNKTGSKSVLATGTLTKVTTPLK